MIGLTIWTMLVWIVKVLWIGSLIFVITQFIWNIVLGHEDFPQERY